VTATSTRAWRVGAALVAAYLAAGVATLGWSGHRLLPLFEGVSIPTAYQWVHPPPQFKGSNTEPHPLAFDVSFTNGKSERGTATTPDGQFIANLPAGAFAPHGTDTAVHVDITPIDPATLGKVPPGLAADGNAYRLQLTYKPSGAPVASLAVAANVVMASPFSAHVLLHSDTGKGWTQLPTQQVSGLSTVGATLTQPGWYLVGAFPSAVGGSSGGGSSTAFIAVLAGVAALVLAAIAFVVAARRR